MARYIARHGTKRVAKAVQIRAGVIGDRSQFYKDLSFPFYGANHRDAPDRDPSDSS